MLPRLLSLEKAFIVVTYAVLLVMGLEVGQLIWGPIHPVAQAASAPAMAPAVPDISTEGWTINPNVDLDAHQVEDLRGAPVDPAGFIVLHHPGFGVSCVTWGSERLCAPTHNSNGSTVVSIEEDSSANYADGSVYDPTTFTWTYIR